MQSQNVYKVRLQANRAVEPSPTLLCFLPPQCSSRSNEPQNLQLDELHRLVLQLLRSETNFSHQNRSISPLKPTFDFSSLCHLHLESNGSGDRELRLGTESFSVHLHLLRMPALGISALLHLQKRVSFSIPARNFAFLSSFQAQLPPDLYTRFR